MAEHSMNLGYCVQFQDNNIQTMRSGCMECIIREALEIELCVNNMNRE
jgi:hypothetical protein